MALTNGRTQVDDKVVAFGVLDIIPTGVSSVYFCYDPASPLSADVKWGQVGPQLRSKLPPLALMRPRLPQISALREIALVQDMRAAGLDNFKYEYLGTSSCSQRSKLSLTAPILCRLLRPLMSQGTWARLRLSRGADLAPRPGR
jgi:hypothetical protein